MSTRVMQVNDGIPQGNHESEVIARAVGNGGAPSLPPLPRDAGEKCSEENTEGSEGVEQKNQLHRRTSAFKPDPFW